MSLEQYPPDYERGQAVFDLAAAVGHLYELSKNAEIGDLVEILGACRDQKRELSQLEREIEASLAELMPDKRVEGPGYVLEKHKTADRKNWDKDRLLQDVLDSRMVDARTGELADESPLDRVLQVWNLPAPRTTALRMRGLDPDDYAETEYGRWVIRVITP